MHAHHDPHHGHEHDHGAPRDGSPAAHRAARAGERRKLMLTIAIVAAIMVAEIIGGAVAHSLALLSDAGHMFSDVVAQALALAAMMLAARPADARRTYGWHRVEILAALGNGLTLLVLAGVIFWEGLTRLRSPVEVHAGLVTMIAGIGLAANLCGAWLLHDTRSLTAKGAYLHILGDALSSLAVLVGGAAMYFARGWYWLDPILSMLIGLFVVYTAARLVREAVDVLLETVPRGIDLAGVTRAIAAVDGVGGVHDLHIWTITSGLHALSVHLVVENGHSDDNDRLMNHVKELLLRDFRIAHTTIQLESAGYEHACHVC
ncbi:MAG TPA: cation diffusion facilitator family transporter [Polyangia bacterium]|nr:cation diffusion facilitator family transporter [Polyangia bacterium]